VGRDEALVLLLWLLIGASLGAAIGWSFGSERFASGLALMGGLGGAVVGAWIAVGGSNGLLGAMRLVSIAVLVAVWAAYQIARVLGRI
jgi:hypothetical protein